MPAAMRQQGVGALKPWRFAAKCKGKWQKNAAGKSLRRGPDGSKA